MKTTRLLLILGFCLSLIGCATFPSPRETTWPAREMVSSTLQPVGLPFSNASKEEFDATILKRRAEIEAGEYIPKNLDDWTSYVLRGLTFVDDEPPGSPTANQQIRTVRVRVIIEEKIYRPRPDLYNIFMVGIKITNDSKTESISIDPERIVLKNRDNLILEQFTEETFAAIALRVTRLRYYDFIPSLEERQVANAKFNKYLLKSGIIPPQSAIYGELYFDASWKSYPIKLEVRIGDKVFHFEFKEKM